MPKEVIHLTFGTLAHHTSTSFFNQQSSHFQFPDANAHSRQEQDDDDHSGAQKSTLILDPNVDFQEGVGSLRGESTFFPRNVVFDFKDSLGTRWDAYDVVYDEQEADDDDHGVLGPSRAANEGLHAWGRPAEVMKLYDGTIGLQSTRWGPLEDDDDEEYETDDEDASQDVSARNSRRTTYARPSAFSHNPLHPRSMRALPALFGGGILSPMASYAATEGRTPLSTFEMGVGVAKAMDRDDSFVDENLRWFAEDSDQLQCFSIYASTFDGFSGLAHEMTQILADEFPKTSVVTWGLDCTPNWHKANVSSTEEKERLDRIRTTNNALALWSLSSTSLYVPISSPLAGDYDNISSKADWSDLYTAGSLYAAHIDTATMSTRLHNEQSRQSMSSILQGLNWRRNTPIAMLGGILPTPLLAPVREAEKPFDPIEALLAARGYDPRKPSRSKDQQLSSEERAQVGAKQIAKKFRYLTPSRLNQTADHAKDRAEKPFAQISTARDEDPLAAQPTQDAMEAWSKLDEPVGRSTFVPLAFNVRAASFPRIFRGLTSRGRPQPRRADDKINRTRSRVEAIPMLSSLVTSPQSAHLLSDARKWIEDVLVKGHAPLATYGIGGSRGRSGAGQAASDETEGFLGGREGLVEIRERLEELLGAYEEGLSRSASIGDEEQIGTDEEFGGEDGDDSDWDM